MLNTILTTASNISTGLNLTDMETCYKAFRHEVLLRIRLQEDGFGVEPELTAKVARGRYRVYEVPISPARLRCSTGFTLFFPATSRST